MLPYGNGRSGEVLMDRHAAHNRPMVCGRHGGFGLRQDHGRQAAGRAAGLALPGGRRPASARERRQDERAARRSPTPTASPGCAGSPNASTPGAARGESGVVTCSALKRAYRDIIIGDRPDVGLVHLKGSRELIGRRMAARQGPFHADRLARQPVRHPAGAVGRGAGDRRRRRRPRRPRSSTKSCGGCRAQIERSVTRVAARLPPESRSPH